MGLLGKIGGITGLSGGVKSNNSNVGQTRSPEFKELSRDKKNREFKKSRFDKLRARALKREIIKDGNWDFREKRKLMEYANDLGTREKSVEKITNDVVKNKGRTFKQRFMDRMAERHYNKNRPKTVAPSSEKRSIFDPPPKKEEIIVPSHLRAENEKPDVGGLERDKHGRVITGKEDSLGTKKSSVGKLEKPATMANPNRPEQSQFASQQTDGGKASADSSASEKTSSITEVEEKDKSEEQELDHEDPTNIKLAE